MIIWLASYPKSGNTWVRAFISSLLYSENGMNDFTQLSKIRGSDTFGISFHPEISLFSASPASPQRPLTPSYH